MTLSGPRRENPCLRGFANNKSADQPAHLRSLISVFVIRLLESIISRLATDEILIFLLVSVAGETNLSLALSETPKTGIDAMRPIKCMLFCFRNLRRSCIYSPTVIGLPSHHISSYSIFRRMPVPQTDSYQ